MYGDEDFVEAMLTWSDYFAFGGYVVFKCKARSAVRFQQLLVTRRYFQQLFVTKRYFQQLFVTRRFFGIGLSGEYLILGWVCRESAGGRI